MMKFLLSLAVALLISLQLFSQTQLLILKKGHVQAYFNEGDYIRLVLKKKHQHSEGHIIELYGSYMITSSDTIQFKDILKINIKKHRAPIQWNQGIGGLLFLGGLVYLAVDQLNVAIGINGSSTPNEVFIPLGVSTVGALMLGIRSKYRHINGIQYLMMVDYRSPFFQK